MGCGYEGDSGRCTCRDHILIKANELRGVPDRWMAVSFVGFIFLYARGQLALRIGSIHVGLVFLLWKKDVGIDAKGTTGEGGKMVILPFSSLLIH